MPPLVKFIKRMYCRCAADLLPAAEKKNEQTAGMFIRFAAKYEECQKMHRFNNEYTVEFRNDMKGGHGEVKFEHIWKKNSDEEMRSSCRQFSRLTLQPGASVGIHSHDNEEEIYYIISGHGRSWDNGQWIEIGPGDATICRSGEEHSMECIGDEPLVYIACIPVYSGK